MESFTGKLNEIKKIIDEDMYRKRVLLLCQQVDPKPFDEYSSSGSFRRLEKFESSTYSEVLKAVDLADNNKPVVMKIMRALSKGVIRKLPAVTTKGCQAYNDILNELVVTQALSQLHDGVILNGKPNALYKTHFFCLIHEIKVVSGNLERILTKPQSKLSSMQTSQHSAIKSQPTSAIRSQEDDGAGAKQSDEVRQQQEQARGSTSSGFQIRMNTKSNKDYTDTIANKDIKQNQNFKSTVGNDNKYGKGSNEDNNNNNNDDDDDNKADDNKKIEDDDLKGVPEEERMLIEALPLEYVVSVMKHDGQPLWWMMTNKKLSAEQLASVLVQVIVGLAIAENVYLYEHRDLHISNILIKKTSTQLIPFVLDGRRFNIVSNGIKATIIDATFSRLTHNGKVFYRDLTSTLRAYGSKRTPPKMSLQNRSYRQMVRLTKNKWDDFIPKTNLIWLTYLCETLMKNDVMKSNSKLLNEITKIRDYTLKVNTTLDLLGYFPFEKEKLSTQTIKTQKDVTTE